MKKIGLALMVAGGLLFARTDALVVAIGEYKNLEEKLSLQGIPKDIENIKSILDAVNISKKNITVIKDREATLKELRRKFNDYINSFKNSEENIFIFYFSGHGIQVADEDGDEDDGQDEASVLYDFKATNKGAVLGGLLLDDELYTYLTKIKSKKILIFDKCHAGSSYRGLVVGFEKIVKGSFVLSDNFAKDINTLPKAENPLTVNFVLSATKDRETAEDSLLGGLFTKSLMEGIVYNKAKNKNGVVTLKSLEKFCNLNILELATFIKKNHKGYDELKGAFHPHFRPNKDESLVNIFNTKVKHSKPLKIKEKKYLLEDMLDSMVSSKVLSLDLDEKSFSVGDSISFEIKSKKSGFLNVLIAYKNSYKLFMENREIKANKKYLFPDNFFKQKHLRASKPLGTTKVYAILSTNKWDIKSNIKNLGHDKRDDMALSNALSKELIPSIEYDIKKKMKQIAQKKEYKVKKPNILGISKVEFNVTK